MPSVPRRALRESCSLLALRGSAAEVIEPVLPGLRWLHGGGTGDKLLAYGLDLLFELHGVRLGSCADHPLQSHSRRIDWIVADGGLVPIHLEHFLGVVGVSDHFRN